MTSRLIISLGLVGGWVFFGCSDSRKDLGDNRNLVGTWTLDSVSMPRGGFDQMERCQTFTFENDSNYVYKSFCGDVHQTFTGKYFILFNAKRGLKTITLIPDIDVHGQDTIRTGYINFDIVKISGDRLQVIDESKFLNRDSLPALVFNKVYIYKRKK